MLHLPHDQVVDELVARAVLVLLPAAVQVARIDDGGVELQNLGEFEYFACFLVRASYPIRTGMRPTAVSYNSIDRSPTPLIKRIAART